MQVQTSYEEAIARKYPEQVAIVIARDANGVYNPITLGWVMPASHEPPMVAIAIGGKRHSLEAIRHSREFVLSFPHSDMAAEAEFFGTHSGRDCNKLKEFGAETQKTAVIDGCMLRDAVANFECRLVSELETGDHVVFVGEILVSHVNENKGLKRLFTLGDNTMGGVEPQK